VENIKAIVLDLDGTLLNSEKKVSNRNLNSILKCYDSGVQIIIATARPPRSIKKMLPPELLRFGYIIFYNGALIINESTKLYEHFTIPRKITNEIYTFISSEGSHIYPCFEVNDEIFSDRLLKKTELIVFGVPENAPIPTVLTKEDIFRLTVSKILLPNFDNIYAKLTTTFQHEVNIIHTDGKELIQIMDKNVSKEQGLQKVLDLLGISPKDTMVFGDDFNDVGVFEMCGFPVAMGNAIVELKNLATIITKTNDDDGVAVILEEIIERKIL